MYSEKLVNKIYRYDKSFIVLTSDNVIRVYSSNVLDLML